MSFEAADGGICTGILYNAGRSRTVVCFMHPQADMSRHYATPCLIAAGYAVFGQNSRWLNNDALCVHETLLLDVAAGVRFLRERGFERVILAGNSGGGSLYCFYIAAGLDPAAGAPARDARPAIRSISTPVDLPAVDGFVMLAAHLGEGRILMQMIDPSVTDERDPLSCDPALDPFNPDNGYRQPPASSTYAPEFVAALSRGAARPRRAARRRRPRASRDAQPGARRAARADFAGRPLAPSAARAARRRSCIRTWSSSAPRPICAPSISRSIRRIATPDRCSPIGPTSPTTWSSASPASPRRAHGSAPGRGCRRTPPSSATRPRVTVPSLVVSYTGDNAIFPSDAQAAFDALGASDKQIASAPGDHYGFGVGTQERTGAPIAFEHVVEWLRARFPRR